MEKGTTVLGRNGGRAISNIGIQRYHREGEMKEIRNCKARNVLRQWYLLIPSRHIFYSTAGREERYPFGGSNRSRKKIQLFFRVLTSVSTPIYKDTEKACHIRMKRRV